MSGSQRMNPTVFILGEEGPLYIISKGVVGGANGPSKYKVASEIAVQVCDPREFRGLVNKVA